MKIHTVDYFKPCFRYLSFEVARVVKLILLFPVSNANSGSFDLQRLFFPSISCQNVSFLRKIQNNINEKQEENCTTLSYVFEL